MHLFAIRFFILLSLLFPALASAACYDPTGNYCIDTGLITTCPSPLQTVNSCPSNQLGICTLINSGTFSLTYYVYAGNSISSSLSDLNLACTAAGGTWSAGNVSLYTLSITVAGTGSGTVASPVGSCSSTCSDSYNGGASVTLTATPASGSTFAGWSGACTGTGISCTLSINAATKVAATFKPVPFAAATTGVTAGGIITDPIATVTTTVSFKPADVGTPQDVFVTAWVPLGATQQARIANYTTLAKPLGTTASNTFALAQLTSSGWRPVNGQLIPYASGVLGDQSAAISILNNTSTANLLGSQFCVGYGTSASDMTSAGRMQLIATIPDPNNAKSNTGSCNVTLPIPDTLVFAYAEANYNSLFPGAATSGQYQQYDYRHYATTQNYLAVDNLGAIWIMGPAFAPPNVPIRVATVESFRGAITTWPH